MVKKPLLYPHVPKKREPLYPHVPNPKFVAYHATPVKNIELIKREGIKRSIQKIPTHRTPTEPVVYFADDVETVIDYAEQSWEYHEMADPRWAIFKIEYDEFPTEPHADVVWGVGGVYWADIDIPPEHVKLYGIFDVEQKRWVDKEETSVE